MLFLKKKVSQLQPIKNGKSNTEKQFNPKLLHLSTKRQKAFALQMMQTLVETQIMIDNKILWQN